jgi:hypothetical protein
MLKQIDSRMLITDREMSPLATRSENRKLASATLRRSLVFFEYCRKQLYRTRPARLPEPTCPPMAWGTII